MGTFRQFVNSHNAIFSLREEEVGAKPPARPENPFGSLEREMGIDDITPALEGGSYTLHSIPKDAEAKLGFQIPTPVEVKVEDLKNGFFEIELLLDDKFISKNKLMYPSDKNVGDNPLAYEGGVENTKIKVSYRDFFQGWMKSLEGGGGMGGMPMGGDPMGGGMGGPPMGDPMGGGMPQPPMGGGM